MFTLLLTRSTPPDNFIPMSTTLTDTLDPLTIKHCAYVTARTPIQMGRIKASPGRVFWVTNPPYIRERDGCIKIAPKERNAGHSIALSFADFSTHFVSAEQ